MENSLETEAVHPIFGVQLTNIDITSIISNVFDSPSITTQKTATFTELKKLVHKHKVVILRNQPVMSAEQQVHISQQFGCVEEAGFEQHPKSPHRLILRVSNDECEGFRDFGTSGFHIDGSFMEKPNDFSIYHMVQKPDQGTTAFVDLNGVFSALSESEKSDWQRLWLVKTYKRIRGYTDHPGYVIHPLVYNHPVTGDKTMCIHQGKTSRFMRDWGVNIAKLVSKEEVCVILDRIEKALSNGDGRFQYQHKWDTGDLILSDNLAVAHMALPDTQCDPDEVGLRIMHRTVIQGTTRPWTDARLCLQQYIQAHNSHTIDMDDIDDEDIDTVRSFSFGDMDKMQKLVKSLKTACQ